MNPPRLALRSRGGEVEADSSRVPMPGRRLGIIATRGRRRSGPGAPSVFRRGLLDAVCRSRADNLRAPSTCGRRVRLFAGGIEDGADGAFSIVVRKHAGTRMLSQISRPSPPGVVPAASSSGIRGIPADQDREWPRGARGRRSDRFDASAKNSWSFCPLPRCLRKDRKMAGRRRRSVRTVAGGIRPMSTDAAAWKAGVIGFRPIRRSGGDRPWRGRSRGAVGHGARRRAKLPRAAAVGAGIALNRRGRAPSRRPQSLDRGKGVRYAVQSRVSFYVAAQRIAGVFRSGRPGPARLEKRLARAAAKAVRYLAVPDVAGPLRPREPSAPTIRDRLSFDPSGRSCFRPRTGGLGARRRAKEDGRDRVMTPRSLAAERSRGLPGENSAPRRPRSPIDASRRRARGGLRGGDHVV
jgi:hypothetical protein